ncbi:MAG: SLC13 family permease [Christensenellales bacterium]|jgi:sodium-dependent dicarboxylate transporter 2/3/5
MEKSLKKEIINYSLIAISVFLMFGIRLFDFGTALPKDAFAVLGVFLGSLILWLFVGIDWTSVLSILALATIKTLGYKSVLSSAFGNDTFTFLLFTFVLTYALSKTPIIKRVAVAFVSNKFARKNGWLFVTMLLFGILVIGCFVSPSVLFIVLLPLIEEIIKLANIEKGEKTGAMLMIGFAFVVSISSGMTPIAHVFPAIAMSNYAQAVGQNIGYLSYMLVAIPVGLLAFAALMLFFRFIMRPDVKKLENIDITPLKQGLPKITKAEIITLTTFISVILIWILPSLIKNLLPDFSTFLSNLGLTLPALLGVVVLCVIKVNKKPLLEINDAFKNGVPWPSLIMCSATLAVGAALTNDGIGLISFLTTNLAPKLSGLPVIALVAIFIIWATLQTNVSSNIVTSTVVSNVAIIVLIANPSINLAALVVLIGMLSAYAFATPPSMPHIALTTSSPYTNTSQVFKYGSLLSVASIVISILAYYFALLIF